MTTESRPLISQTFSVNIFKLVDLSPAYRSESCRFVMDKYNTPCVCSRVQQLLAVLFSGDWDVQYLQDADVCVFRKESLLPRARDASRKMRVLYETATRLRATRDTSDALN
jgi:hypothetical protein